MPCPIRPMAVSSRWLKSNSGAGPQHAVSAMSTQGDAGNSARACKLVRANCKELSHMHKHDASSNFVRGRCYLPQERALFDRPMTESCTAVSSSKGLSASMAHVMLDYSTRYDVSGTNVDCKPVKSFNGVGPIPPGTYVYSKVSNGDVP